MCVFCTSFLFFLNFIHLEYAKDSTSKFSVEVNAIKISKEKTTKIAEQYDYDEKRNPGNWNAQTCRENSGIISSVGELSHSNT